MNLLIERKFKVKTRTNTLGDANVCRHLRIFKRLLMFAAISVIIYMCNYLKTYGDVTISWQKNPASLMLAKYNDPFVCQWAINNTQRYSFKRFPGIIFGNNRLG